MGKLINRIPGLCILISSLPGSALKMHVESLGILRMSTSLLKALPGKLARHSPSILHLHSWMLYLLMQESRTRLSDNNYPGEGESTVKL